MKIGSYLTCFPGWSDLRIRRDCLAELKAEIKQSVGGREVSGKDLCDNLPPRLERGQGGSSQVVCRPGGGGDENGGPDLEKREGK